MKMLMDGGLWEERESQTDMDRDQEEEKKYPTMLARVSSQWQH